MNSSFTLAAASFLLVAFSSRGMGREPSAEAVSWFNEQEAAWQAILSMDPYAREALALNPQASYGERVEAIRTLAENPLAHMGTLEALMQESHLGLRLAAIEVIESLRPDIAHSELLGLLRDLVPVPVETVSPESLLALRAADLLARLGDGSALPYVARQLLESPRGIEQISAILALSGFFYLKELEPYKPLVAFVEHRLPQLAPPVGDAQRRTQTIINKALYKLAGLHAVEAIPDFERWQADPRFEPVRDTVEFNLRRLRDMQAALDRGEPDPRDAVKITPGTAPAWKLPKAVRD